MPPAITIDLASGALEQEAMESAMESLAPLFAGGAGDRSALFVVSPDAGNATALRFWGDAIRMGVALTSPQRFPWCLANAPAAALARRFGITGPNISWQGGDETLSVAWDAANLALREGRIDRAFLVSVGFGSPSGASGRLRAWCLHVPACPA